MILWSKLRRSRGFGIHSPFAFDLVLHTLRERAPYYSYPEIRKLLADAREKGIRRLPSEKELRLTVRLVARFQPRSAEIFGDESGLIAATIALADSRVTPTDDNPAMVIIAGRADEAAKGAAVAAVRAGGVVLLLDRRKNRATAQAIMASMRCGMTFYSRHKLLAVGAPHLPRQNFEIYY